MSHENEFRVRLKRYKGDSDFRVSKIIAQSLGRSDVAQGLWHFAMDN
jgi:hypothetical protein